MSEASDANELGIRAWELLLRTQAALVTRLEDSVRDQTGLPLSWYDALLELNRAPGRALRMTELGDRVVLSRSRVSRVVDAMAEADLVEKRPDPVDGRATLAVLTPQGRAALRRAAPVYLDGIRRHFAEHLTGPETRALVRGLGRVLTAAEEGDASSAP